MKTNKVIKNRNRWVAALAALVCFALLPAQAVSPAPDGSYPEGNTAEGQMALFSLTTGQYNAAIGWVSLYNLTSGNFNTGIGAGTLFNNTTDSNAATGAAALFFNTSGTQEVTNPAPRVVKNPY